MDTDGTADPAAAAGASPADLEYELVREISELGDTPPSPERDARISDVVRRAEEGDHVNALMLGHLLQTHDAVLAGDLATIAGAFARTEESWATHRDRLESYVVPAILVQYLSLLFTILRRPGVPIARIEAVADSLDHRCRDLGRSRAEALRVRMICAERRGASAEAEEWFRAWRAEPRDDLLPELADTGVTWLTGRGDHDGAVALHAEAMLRADDPAEIHLLHAAVLESLVASGRLEEAERVHRECIALPNDAAQRGQHLAYQAQVGHLDEEWDGLADTVATLPALSGWAAGTFAAYAVTFLRRLRTAGRGSEVLGTEPIEGIEGAVTVDAVFTMLVRRAEEVAREYDDVNDLDGLTLGRLHHYWVGH